MSAPCQSSQSLSTSVISCTPTPLKRPTTISHDEAFQFDLWPESCSLVVRGEPI